MIEPRCESVFMLLLIASLGMGCESITRSSSQASSPGLAIVAFDVEPIRQRRENDCWAVVTAMMLSWKYNRPVSVEWVIETIGREWMIHYEADTGLTPELQNRFVQDVGFISKPPANYTPQAWIDMLETHGPLWVGTGEGPFAAHARLLIGIYGDGEYGSTTFKFIDPATGDYALEPDTVFYKRFEQEVRFLVDHAWPSDILLRVQIIHL